MIARLALVVVLATAPVVARAGEDAAARRGPVRVELLEPQRSRDTDTLLLTVEIRNGFTQRVCGQVTFAIAGPGAGRPLLRRTVTFMNLASGERRRFETVLDAGSLVAGRPYVASARLRAATPLLPGHGTPVSHEDASERTFGLEDLDLAPEH